MKAKIGQEKQQIRTKNIAAQKLSSGSRRGGVILFLQRTRLGRGNLGKIRKKGKGVGGVGGFFVVVCEMLVRRNSTGGHDGEGQNPKDDGDCAPAHDALK